MKAPANSRKAKPQAALPKWKLRLYVAGQSSKSDATFRILKQLCEKHLSRGYRIEVIDLLRTPQLAKGDQILALPAVVRSLPAPIRKVVGNLSDTARVLVGLDLRPCDAEPVAVVRNGEEHV